jgi:hypothetical protein
MERLHWDLKISLRVDSLQGPELAVGDMSIPVGRRELHSLTRLLTPCSRRGS